MIRLNTTIKSVEANESGELVIKGNASTPSTDRARDVILLDAWAKGGIDNYRKNPILLFNHNYDEPIGKVTEMNLTDRGLEVEGVVFEGSKAFPLIKNGVLKTFSVGFLIKDADYNKATDGLIIKDAELLEISVVSVPCNQEATFEVSKSYSDEEFEELKEKFGKETSDKGAKQTPETPKMDEDQVNELIAKSVADALAKAEEAREAKEKAALDAAEKAKEEETRITATVTKTVAEKVEEAVKAALEAHTPEAPEGLDKTLSELQDTIKQNAEEIKSLRESRGGFFPDKNAGTDLKGLFKDRDLANKAVESMILAKATGKPIMELDYTKEVIKAVNTQSSIQVSSEAYEQEVTNRIEADIQQELVLQPLFREVQLRSASQLLMIAPEPGYATHQTTGSTLPGTKPNGLLQNADGSQPYALSEISFRTDKLVSKAYLANDTDEDTLIPLLGFIRDAMVRQHAKSVDQMILNAGVAGGIYPNMVSKGLLAYATGARRINGPAPTGAITGANLLAARAQMGKYGLNPRDVVYVVNTTGYFQLLQDEAFYDASTLGNPGTLATGEVGRMFGSRIIVSAEMDATPADNVVAAMAINTRNFVIPRLRGYTFETEYSVDGQHQLLATTQRLGFTEVIPDAASVVAIQYNV